METTASKASKFSILRCCKICTLLRYGTTRVQKEPYLNFEDQLSYFLNVLNGVTNEIKALAENEQRPDTTLFLLFLASCTRKLTSRPRPRSRRGARTWRWKKRQETPSRRPLFSTSFSCSLLSCSLTESIPWVAVEHR